MRAKEEEKERIKREKGPICEQDIAKTKKKDER